MAGYARYAHSKTDLTEDETRSMESLDTEYRQNETRYRAALISEDEERKEAGAELETRESSERAEVISQFEVRQVVLALGEEHILSGATQEIVSEMRNAGGFQGVPIPLEALEVRAGETIASGAPDPVSTRPIIDRLFVNTAAERMGTQFINIPVGEVEWPVVTQGAVAAWATNELGEVGPAVDFKTVDKALKPDFTLGAQMKISRRAMKQSGAALEAAIRRDMNGAIRLALDKAVFQGQAAMGQPAGFVARASEDYGIAVADPAAIEYEILVDALSAMMEEASITDPKQARLAIDPLAWAGLDAQLHTGTAVSYWDRIAALFGTIVRSNQHVVSVDNVANPAPAGTMASAVITTSATGVAPVIAGVWGGIDLIRDQYTDAASGQLRLTGLVTADITVPRPQQIRILQTTI